MGSARRCFGVSITRSLGLCGIDLGDEIWVADDEVAGERLREGREHGACGHDFVVDLYTD